jgi:hypothetical protein
MSSKPSSSCFMPGSWCNICWLFFLIVVTPLWDRYEIRRLKASKDPQKKVRFYRKVVAASWICAVVAVLAVGLVSVFTIPKVLGEIVCLDAGSRGSMVLEGITTGMLIMLLLPAALALWNDKIRAKAGKAAKKLAFLLPPDERRAAVLVGGVPHGWNLRGSRVSRIADALFPCPALSWSLTWAPVASSVVFGIGHLYQGAVGAVQTALIGLVLGAMFLVTGNLLLPIAVHAVLDLGALMMLPEGFASAEG